MEFINHLNKETFTSTNTHWNDLNLNDPWSIGYVSTLIETRDFASKEEWEEYFYESGSERENLIQILPKKSQELLYDYKLKITNPNLISQLSWDIKNLNFQYGRTKLQIEEKGQILFDYVISKGVKISLSDCIECVRFRTICETWNGIIIRERNTVITLQRTFPNTNFIKTTGDFDYKFAVDYELKKSENIICGIQIKPKSYLGTAPYVKKAQKANQQKNAEYIKLFNKPVFDVISQANGNIINQEVIKHIENAIKSI